MASYHFTIKDSSQTKASANLRSDYINREGIYATGAKAEELLYKDHGNLPEWAENSPNKFWAASELYEKTAGRTSFREIEFALPNELDLQQQKELVKEFINKHFGQDFIYSYAIHEKAAALDKGVQNPHVHILFCERKLDGIKRNKEIFFKRANPKQPERGGCKKDPRWNGKDRRGYLVYMREDCANLQNRYLERDGFSERVDHRTKKIQFQAAILAGDLDKAQLLDSPAEKHLGPKLSSKIARELNSLTVGIADPKKRKELRQEYWASHKNMQELYQLKQVREWKTIVNEMQDIDQKRSLFRETNAEEIASKVFWQVQKKELNNLRSKLDLEKYRLEKAEANTKNNPKRQAKIAAWRKHYETKVAEYKQLKSKIEKQELTPEETVDLKDIGNNIVATEQEKSLQKEKHLTPSFLKTHTNLIPTIIIKKITSEQIKVLDKELKKLGQTDKRLIGKMRSEIQARIIAEWRVSGGVIAAIKRAEKVLLAERKKLKQETEMYKNIDIDDKQKEQLTKRQAVIKELTDYIIAQKNGWEIQKQKPENKVKIEQLQNKIVARNENIKAQLDQTRSRIETLKMERSKWRSLEYTIKRAGRYKKNLYLKSFIKSAQHLLREMKTIQAQLQRAVSKLQADRPRGRMSLRLQFDDDFEKRADAHELER